MKRQRKERSRGEKREERKDRQKSRKHDGHSALPCVLLIIRVVDVLLQVYVHLSKEDSVDPGLSLWVGNKEDRAQREKKITNKTLARPLSLPSVFLSFSMRFCRYTRLSNNTHIHTDTHRSTYTQVPFLFFVFGSSFGFPGFAGVHLKFTKIGRDPKKEEEASYADELHQHKPHELWCVRES